MACYNTRKFICSAVIYYDNEACMDIFSKIYIHRTCDSTTSLQWYTDKTFIKSYVGVCLEGAVIVLACIIFSAFASASTPNIDTSITTVTMIWKYIGEVIFNMLILVGIIKGADRIVKEMLGT